MAFSPEPRRDGWTPERRRTFLEALASGANVRRAAARAGMAREGAYRLRRRDAGFARAWEAAQRAARAAAERAFIAALPDRLRDLFASAEFSPRTVSGVSAACDLRGPGKSPHDPVPPVPPV